MQWRKDFAKLEGGISFFNRNFFFMIVSLILPHSIPDAYTLIVQFLNSENIFYFCDICNTYPNTSS